MALWHVSRDGQQREPVSLEVLLGQIRAAEVFATDLVWTEGMAEWQPAQSIPALAAAMPGGGGAAAAGAPTPAGLSGSAMPAGFVNYQMPTMGTVLCTEPALQSLRKTGPWVRLIAVLLFIGGGFCAIGGVIMLLATSLATRSRSGGPMLGVLLGYGISAVVYLALGLYLNRYASSISRLMTYRREDQLEAALAAQQKFWRLAGILTTIVLGLFVVMFAGMFVFAIFR